MGIDRPLFWLIEERNSNSGVYLVFYKIVHYCESTKKDIYQYHTIVHDSNYEICWDGKGLKDESAQQKYHFEE